MSIIDRFIERSKDSEKKLVLPEGQDPRVVSAANKIAESEIAEVTVLGNREELESSCADAGVTKRLFDVIDPAESEHLQDFAAEFCEIRKKKKLDMDRALEYMRKRLFFGAMMTRKGLSDGMVAGSIASTSDMLVAAFTVIGTAAGIDTASSNFIMDLRDPAPSGDNVLLFADCAVNPDPDAAQLSDIAVATAICCRSLLEITPRVAFLSFSTNGSARHRLLDKIREAAKRTSQRIVEMGIEALVDPVELQADTAIVPSVAAKKYADSLLGGGANVLIFPDLNAGNICYKLTQRLAGAGAYGPILQGLAKPLNDLSRGCSVDDIVGVGAVTVCQSIGN